MQIDSSGSFDLEDKTCFIFIKFLLSDKIYPGMVLGKVRDILKEIKLKQENERKLSDVVSYLKAINILVLLDNGYYMLTRRAFEVDDFKKQVIKIMFKTFYDKIEKLNVSDKEFSEIVFSFFQERSIRNRDK